MRRLATLFAIAVLAVSCSDASSTESTTTTTESVHEVAITTTVAEPSIPPQLEGFEVQDVQVGNRSLLLAIADNPSLRQQGLMEVTDLGDLDGMLFFWRHDGDAFWMKDTLIPLDIVWFNEDGTFKGRDSMEPCTADPCPTYQPDNLDFRYAIEAPPGTLDWITSDTVITYTDD